jgi:peroxiredoxin Q/BCP
MMGRKYMGVARTTFIIDPRGMIAKVFPQVKVQGHSAEVLAALRGMQNT